MDHATPFRQTVENPRGFLSAKVDGNGRIKLPARFLEYLAQLADKRMYVTLINGMARMYMNGSWERNLDLFAGEPKKRKALELVAAKYGQDVEADEAGRVTLPLALRKKLNLENQQIQFRFDRDVALIYDESRFEADTDQAEEFVNTFIGGAEDEGFI